MTPPALPVLIQIDENPNCIAWDSQVFQPRTAPRKVSRVRVERGGDPVWCEITGVDEAEQGCPAMACLVDDSGDGACFLIFGGSWGLQLKDASKGETWGVPYLLLPASGADVQFVS